MRRLLISLVKGLNFVVRKVSGFTHFVQFALQWGFHPRPEWFDHKRSVGVTAGASAPELLVRRVVARLQQWGGQGPDEVLGREENVVFALPKELRLDRASPAAGSTDD